MGHYTRCAITVPLAIFYSFLLFESHIIEGIFGRDDDSISPDSRENNVKAAGHHQLANLNFYKETHMVYKK